MEGLVGLVNDRGAATTDRQTVSAAKRGLEAGAKHALSIWLAGLGSRCTEEAITAALGGAGGSTSPVRTTLRCSSPPAAAAREADPGTVRALAYRDSSEAGAVVVGSGAGWTLVDRAASLTASDQTADRGARAGKPGLASARRASGTSVCGSTRGRTTADSRRTNEADRRRATTSNVAIGPSQAGDAVDTSS